MPLSSKERQLLTRQLFEAVGAVGFATWKRDHPKDAQSGVAELGEDRVRQHYFQEFERTAWAEIKELTSKAPDHSLEHTVRDWMGRAASTEKHSMANLKAEGQRKQPMQAKSKDRGMER